jgi:hypothetical protein
VEVVGGMEIDDEVDVDVETGTDTEVEVDEEVVVEVGGGTEVVVGTRVVEDEVDVEVVVGTVVEDVEVVEVVEVGVVVAVVEDDVEVVEVDVVEVVVVEVDVVEVDDVVVGTTLPPWMLPTLIPSATNVPRMVALKRFRIAGFSSAQSWATTAVVFIPNDRLTTGVKLHVVVASGTGWAAGWPEKTGTSGVPPAMLTAFCLPLTSTRRSCGAPSTLICELGRTSKESTTSSTLGASATTSLPLFMVTLQKT